MTDLDRIHDALARYQRAAGDAPLTFNEARRETAERAVAGEIYFQGGRWVRIGRRDIDWSGRHIDHHVWHERPKRFLYMPDLIAGYRVTGDERYAETARDYIADWMRAHPARPDWAMPQHDNGLNLGIRVQFFARAIGGFHGSAHWDAEFVARVLEDIGCELRFISGRLSPKGNFRMKQAMTLLECGLCLTVLPDAAEWRRLGAAVMNDAGRRQLLPDGVHVECNPNYHAWMARLFGECLLLQREWPELAFGFDAARIAAMHDYSLAATKPNGSVCGIHDCEGHWEGEHADDHRLTARDAFRRAHDLPAEQPPTHQAFASAGQVYMRDGWGSDAGYMVFDATRWGGAHCHLSRLGIQLHAHGRSLLVDPGRISYEMSDPRGPYAKSTRAHSTLNLNGWNQFTTNPDRLQAWHAPGHDCVSATYSGGYWDGPFAWWFSEGLGHGIAAVHTRHVYWVHGRFAVVIDEITRWRESADRAASHTAPSLEVNWQFSPGELTVDPEQRRAHTNHADGNLLLHVAHAPVEATLSVHDGQTDPPRGWLRDAAGADAVPAPQLSLTAAPWEGFVETIVTLLVPYAGDALPDPRTEVSLGDMRLGRPSRLTVSWPDGARDEIAWTDAFATMLGPDALGDTDGVLHHRHTSAAGSQTHATVDASYSPPGATALQATL